MNPSSSKPRFVDSRSIWIRSGPVDRQDIFRPIREGLLERGVTVLTLEAKNDTEGIERIRKTVWNTDAHVVLDGLTATELGALKGIFQERKNFSVALVDWWTSNYWFTRHAHYVIVRNYSGIAARRGWGEFCAGRRPPLLAWPQSRVPLELASCALRLPALLSAPFLELWKWRQRQTEAIPPERMLYFPFCVTEKHVPLVREKPEYDFSNLGSTSGYWLLRDPFASAWLNFGNLYYDRLRLIELMLKFENQPFKMMDVRRLPGRRVPSWEDFVRQVARSRYVIATGGVHLNSVAKYLEFACLGVPMLGEDTPFEFPWLEKCLISVDPMNVTPERLKPMLDEAIARYPVMREQTLALREPLLKMYHPQRLLDLLQEQADGKPMPPGYLKPRTA